MPRRAPDDLRERFVTAGIGLFDQNGYAATSLQSISAEVGYSKSALLYHFESKEALLRAALQDIFSKLEALFDELQKGPEETLQQRTIETVVEFALENSSALSVIVRSSAMLQSGAGSERGNAVILRARTLLTGSDELSLAQTVRVSLVMNGLALMMREFPHVDKEEMRAAMTATLQDILVKRA